MLRGGSVLKVCYVLNTTTETQYTQIDETGFKSLAVAVVSKAGGQASKQAKQASNFFSFLFLCRPRIFRRQRDHDG